jgi:hypothetical protein
MNKKAQAFLAVFLLLTNQAAATVVVVLINDSAIVIGTDSKGVTGNSAALEKGSGISGHQSKIVLLNNSILAAASGIVRFASPSGRVKYDFTRWVTGLTRARHKKTPTVSELAIRIRDACLPIFQSEYGGMLAAGILRPLNLSGDPSLPVVTYYVAGYESHKARAFTITITIDWNKRVLGTPTLKPIYPQPPNSKHEHFLFAWQGKSKAGIDELIRDGSPTQGRYVKMYPREMSQLLNDQVMNYGDSVQAVRMALAAEIEGTPSAYSYPIEIYALPAMGGPDHRKYDK